MKLRTMRIYRLRFVAILISLVALSSCQSMVYDVPSEDCVPVYLIHFRYDYNAKSADAAAQEVKDIALHVFDDKGVFVTRLVADGEALKRDGFRMKLSGINPGKYTFVAWGGTENNPHFILPTLTPGTSKLDDLQVAINNVEGKVSENIADPSALFHVILRDQELSADAIGEQVIEAGMMKNTNYLLVHIASVSEDLDPTKYHLSITSSDNEVMGYDNRVSGRMLQYLPWASTQVDLEGITMEGAINTKGLVGEFMLGRILTDSKARLELRDENGDILYSVPLAKTLLIGKGKYRSEWSDQEYLDRVDEYRLQIILNSRYKWRTVRLMVNGWVVVPNETVLGE